LKTSFSSSFSVSLGRIYRAGEILLDLDQLAKVVVRTKEPVLEPEMDFERRGVVANVVFRDEAVVQNGQLLTCYGGADKVCCSVSVPINELLDELVKESQSC
jgi:predicted GH43/DUF377 family glycosyl hydrolase